MTYTSRPADVGVIYIQKGIELLVFEFDISGQAGWFSVVVAILFALFVYFLERSGTLSFGRESSSSNRIPISTNSYNLAAFWARKFVADYAFAACIVLFTGFVHIPGQIKSAGIEFLDITKSFYPSTK